jgi:NADP-dependent 3-hydroxy acid dehydrogenase YdfG
MITQTVLITGAAGYVGQAVANVFQQRGERLVLVDRRTDALKRRFGGSEHAHGF